MAGGILARVESVIETLGGKVRWLPLGLVLVCALIAGSRAHWYGHRFAAGADATAYMFNAQIIAAGDLVLRPRPVMDLPLQTFRPLVYEPHGMTASLEDRVLYPTYTFGYPLLLATVGVVTGGPMETTVRWALVLVAMAVPLVVYALARQLRCAPFWALVAAGAISLSPLTQFLAMDPMSDLWSLVLGCMVMLATLRVRETSGRGAEIGWHVVLGCAWAWALHTRMTNALLVVPMVLSWWIGKRRWTIGWAVTLVLMALGVIGLGWLNERFYGSPWRTGYGDMDTLFRAEHFGPGLTHLVRWMGPLLSPLLAIGFGLSLIAALRGRFVPALLWSWFGGLAVFYCFYEFTHETWWYLRFVLPGLPAAAIAGSWLWQNVERKWSRPISALLLRLLVVIWGVSATTAWTRKLVRFEDPAASIYVWLDAWMEAHMPPEQFLLCDIVSESVYFNRPNPIVRYFGLEPATWSLLQAEANRRDLPIYCAVVGFEVNQWGAFEHQVPGNWIPLATHGDLTVYELGKTEPE